MADIPLPQPKNQFIEVMDIILDTLILGLGENVAIAAATTYLPWLNLPVIHWLFVQLVKFLAERLDTSLKLNAGAVVIRFQNDSRKADYDKAIDEIKKPGATPDEIQAARDAIDRLVNRSR